MVVVLEVRVVMVVWGDNCDGCYSIIYIGIHDNGDLILQYSRGKGMMSLCACANNVWIYRLQFPILESMYCTVCNMQHKNPNGFSWYLLMDTIRFGEGSESFSFVVQAFALHLQTRHPVPMRWKGQYKSWHVHR